MHANTTEMTSQSPPPSPSMNPETLQIFVKSVAGETTPLTIHPDTTIADIKTLIPLPPSTDSSSVPSSDSTSSSSTSFDNQSLRLTHAGRHLSSPTATFASLAIPAGSTLHLAFPLAGGNDSTKESETDAAMAKAALPATDVTSSSSSPSVPATPSKPKSAAARKPRCGFKSCKDKIQPIVGDCGFCKGRFCAKHRMLESHSCEGLEDCKDEARERNREQLEKERTRPLQAI